MHGQHAGLALTGDSDPGSPLEGIRTLERILSRFYAPYGKSGAFQNVIFPRTGHVYNDHTKQAMLEWFDRFLRG
jgi:hypothetical protein